MTAAIKVDLALLLTEQFDITLPPSTRLSGRVLHGLNPGPSPYLSAEEES